jgi:hypothetical protein
LEVSVGASQIFGRALTFLLPHWAHSRYALPSGIPPKSELQFAVRVNGTAATRDLCDGYALTENVPDEVRSAWLHDNGGSALEPHHLRGRHPRRGPGLLQAARPRANRLRANSRACSTAVEITSANVASGIGCIPAALMWNAVNFAPFSPGGHRIATSGSASRPFNSHLN